MGKNKLVIILIIALLFMIGGCKKSERVVNSKDFTTSKSHGPVITAAPTNTPKPSEIPTIAPTATATVTPVILSSLSPEELSMDAYEKFIENEAKVSFDRVMPEIYMEEPLFERGCEYTLSEVLDIVTANYFEYDTNKKIERIDYGYIDCGKDGVKELSLRFNGMDIYSEDDGSTLVYIIKYIDEKLSLCAYYETWPRCDASINEYGYYQSGGSNGASNHGDDYGLIDKDGNWQSIVYIESEIDINQLAFTEGLEQLPVVAETKGISDNFELITIRFDNTDNTDDDGIEECYYTFNVYDDDWNRIEDENLYTDSIYKEMFDEANIPFITLDEVSALISEKEDDVGATAEIINGAEIEWKTLNLTTIY